MIPEKVFKGSRVHTSNSNHGPLILSPASCHLMSGKRKEDLTLRFIAMLSVYKLFQTHLGGMLRRQGVVKMGCRTNSAELCMTRHPNAVAHCPPLINKWRDHPGGQESSAGPFATAMPWLTGIQNGHPPRLPVRRLLTLSLVMGRRAGGGVMEGGWVGTRNLPLFFPPNAD